MTEHNTPTGSSEHRNASLFNGNNENRTSESTNPAVEKGEAEASPPAAWGSDAPDGGATAWLVVLGAWCALFCSWGWVNSIGVFQDYYATGPLKNYSESTISWIPSLQIFFMMALGPIIGKLYDTYGPRQLLLVGSFLHVFGLMMASLATEYYQFLLSQGVCSAIGVSIIFLPSISVIPAWFNKKRGAAYGILSTGSSLGGVIFPILLTRIINKIGYGWAMRISAFLILGLLIIANLTIRSLHPPRPTVLTKEQMAQPFKEPAFLFLLGGMFLLTFGIFVPIDYLPSEALAHGFNQNLSQYLVPIFNAGSLFGRLGAGALSDVVGKYNVMFCACIASGLLTLALWIPGTSQSAIIAYAVLFGFFSGAYVSLMGALPAQISPPREIGFRTGLVFIVASVGGLTTSPIAGAILSNTGDWVNLMIFSGVLLIVGAIVVFCTRIVKVGTSLTAVF